MPQDNLDPLRHIEGFPIGDDADLHALSDPPHYTAYPNPHLAEFIAQHGAPYDEASDDYHREPYVADVSEGKNDPIYNAHSYHTKVPYKAIIPFIEHYTQPGDIVFDGFCGTGMTGVAAQMAGRRAILCDLSPAASFIAYNYNTPVDVKAFEREAKRILKEVEAECGWMYETKHPDGRTGRINYTVWSDVFICPYCDGEIVFWDAAVDEEAESIKDQMQCPTCKAEVTKRDAERAIQQSYDNALSKTIEQAKQKPVLINYSISGKRFSKQPDEFDLAIVEKISNSEIPYWHPIKTINIGDKTGELIRLGITNVHHLYTKRNLWVLAKIFNCIQRDRLLHSLGFWFTATLPWCGRENRLHISNYFKRKGGVITSLRGTWYVASLSIETSVIERFKLRTRSSKLAIRLSSHKAVSTQSTTDISNISENCIDYIFTDPPFGDNLMYSELNIAWEGWLSVHTNTVEEAIINRSQRKTLDSYRVLMTHAFSELYRILKPGHWITVVFHNSKASVWNAIQEGLAHAGFLVAQVTVMDKGKGSFNQATAAGAVKNDLVINAYKPRAGFSQKFTLQAGRGLEADFVRQHLQQLPLAANVERSKEMLYSKYLAYYVQHGYQVQYNGEQFYRALAQWGLLEADGYWFSDEAQLRDYATRSTQHATPPQAPLFVFDERSAIQWLKHFLHGTPATLSDIQPAYLKALQTSQDQMPDLRELLDENFGQPDSAGRYHWPNPQLQQTLEEARQQRLLRHFNDYLQQAQAGQRLKEVRKEALVAGFTEAYRAGRFADILAIGRRLDKRLLEENLELFDFVEIAEAKLEG